MPSILVTRKLPASVLARLEQAGDVDLHVGEQAIAPDELRRRVAGTDALVCMLTEQIDRGVLEAGVQLKIVANVAVGYNNIDVAAARARGVVVTNTPDVLTESVADFTWALDSGHHAAPVGRGAAPAARRLEGLGVRLHARHRAPRQAAGARRVRTDRAGRGRARGCVRHDGGDRQPAPGATSPAGEAMSLDRLLNTSDVVSLHVPLSPETHHLIDRRALARMKRSAYLVNTARGPVVDEEALAWALQQHLIAGAALDVYEREPVVHPDLLQLENVLLVPHLASGTTETRTAMADLAAANVVAVLGGRPPLTPVSRVKAIDERRARHARAGPRDRRSGAASGREDLRERRRRIRFRC